jgi:hypothetical protein
MMGIGAQRLNPSYKEFFHASVGMTGFVESMEQQTVRKISPLPLPSTALRACFFKSGEL